MDVQDLAYALNQVVHNFGAVVVTGAAIAGLAVERPSVRHGLACFAAAAWAVQIMSGAVFGAISFYYYARLPDLSAIASAALAIKVGSAMLGLVLALLYVMRAQIWTTAACRRAWRALAALGVTALTAAAFLRWFS